MGIIAMEIIDIAEVDNGEEITISFTNDERDILLGSAIYEALRAYIRANNVETLEKEAKGD